MSVSHEFVDVENNCIHILYFWDRILDKCSVTKVDSSVNLFSLNSFLPYFPYSVRHNKAGTASESSSGPITSRVRVSARC